MLSFKSFQSFFFYHANIHAHAHHDKVIAISVPQYYVVGVNNNCTIIAAVVTGAAERA